MDDIVRFHHDIHPTLYSGTVVVRLRALKDALLLLSFDADQLRFIVRENKT